jgi:hypothetical protein
MKNILVLSFVFCQLFVIAQKQNIECYAEVKNARPFEYRVCENDKINLIQVSIKTSITEGFSQGNAKMVGSYFNSNVDVSLLGKENLYSKSQAVQVLKTFFIDHAPKGFSIIHEGNSNNLKYFIGSLLTDQGNFRITLNIKSINNSEFISRLTIEEE